MYIDNEYETSSLIPRYWINYYPQDHKSSVCIIWLFTNQASVQKLLFPNAVIVVKRILGKHTRCQLFISFF